MGIARVYEVALSQPLMKSIADSRDIEASVLRHDAHKVCAGIQGHVFNANPRFVIRLPA